MKKKLFFILFGLLAFASSSSSKESFMTYIGKYESLEFPVILKCKSVIQYPKINMSDLETIYGIPNSELYFEMSDYDEDNDIRYNVRIDSLSAHFIGYCLFDKYILVLITTVRDSYEYDSYGRDYYCVFTKDGNLIDRILINELQFDSRKYFFSIFEAASSLSYISEFSKSVFINIFKFLANH